MKKHLLILLLILVGKFSFGTNTVYLSTKSNYSDNYKNVIPDSGSKTNFTINAFDTLVFDISQTVVNGNHVSFPVYFLSDDTINAVDFSLKYNQSNFTYDSILDVTTYMQSLSHYDSNSQTIFFTSSSLMRITNDTTLLWVTFTVLSGQLCDSDLNTVHAYLNGDPCTVKVTNCISSGVTDINNLDQVKIYPNPASEILNVEAPEKSIIELSGMDGNRIILLTNFNSGTRREINIGHIANGIYLLKIYSDNFVDIKKVVVQN